MKRTTMVLGGLLTLSLVANGFADTTNVYSRNAVGYVNMRLYKGFNLISVQLNKGNSAEYTIGDILGTKVPDFMTVYGFIPPAGPYISYTFFGGTWSDDQTGLPGAETNVMTKGSGLWVYVPTDYTNDTYDVSVMGEVPSSTNATAVVVANGFTIFSYPFPVSRSFADTAFSTSVQDFDVVYVWSNDAWVGYLYFNHTWSDVDTGVTVTPPVLEPGKSYYYVGSQDRVVNLKKPYQWP